MHFELRGTQDMMKLFSFLAPFILIRCVIYLVIEGGSKYAKIELVMGVTISSDSTISRKITYLLFLLYVRLSHKTGLLNLTNRTQFKNING